MTMEFLDQVELKMAILYMAPRNAFADQSIAVVHLVDDGEKAISDKQLESHDFSCKRFGSLSHLLLSTESRFMNLF